MASATDSRSAKHETLRDLPETLLVAQIVRPHGIRGEVKVDVHSDIADRFDRGRELLLNQAGGASRRVRIASSRLVRGGRLLKLEGCDDRDAAERFIRNGLAIEGAFGIGGFDRQPPKVAVNLAFALAGIEHGETIVRPIGIRW